MLLGIAVFESSSDYFLILLFNCWIPMILFHRA